MLNGAEFTDYLAEASAALDRLGEFRAQNAHKPPRCRHKATWGAWLSAGHVVRCLGVPGGELAEAILDRRLRSRVLGDAPRTHAQVLATDVQMLWPESGR